MWRLEFCPGSRAGRARAARYCPASDPGGGGGSPVSKDRLIESAWPGLAIEESNLAVQIAVLRRVFAEEPGGDSWIATLPRRGYRYVGPVAVKEQKNQGAAGNEQPALAPPDKPSLAVMPFTNMSGDPEQEYFADGMVEEIITGLSRIKWLFVIARDSSFIYKGQAVNVGRVGRELGVRYVLEGSVRKAGERVRVSGQLIEAETGVHLWAERYDRRLDDVFALQDEITLNVVGAIEPSLREAEIERVKRKQPENLDAYDLVLRALPHVVLPMPTEAAKAMPLLKGPRPSSPITPAPMATSPGAIRFYSSAADSTKRTATQPSGMHAPPSPLAATMRRR